MEDTSLDIVLPCYNPPEGWVGKVLEAMERIRAALPGISIRLILVNDGSTQGLKPGEVEQLRSKVSEFQFIDSQPNEGKGYALRKGVAAATGTFQIYTDIDFPYQEQSLVDLYKVLESGEADVVAGVRESDYYEGVPAGRKRISRMLRWMLRTFLRLEITDTQCGLKGFNAKGRGMFLQTSIDRFLFDLEFIYLASNDPSVRLKPAKVVLKPDVVFSKVNWRILLGESWNFMRIFFRGLWRRMFGRRARKS